MTDPGISESKTRGCTYFRFCSGLFIFLRRGAFELCCTHIISQNLIFKKNTKQLILIKFSPPKAYQKKNVCCLGSTPAATICTKHITEVSAVPYHNWKTSHPFTRLYFSGLGFSVPKAGWYIITIYCIQLMSIIKSTNKHENLNCQRKINLHIDLRSPCIGLHRYIDSLKFLCYLRRIFMNK